MRRCLTAEGYPSVARYVYPPGTFFEEHSHRAAKMDAVLAGEFLITLEGQEFLLRAGDAIQVPAGARHSARVMGPEPVISLDATVS